MRHAVLCAAFFCLAALSVHAQVLPAEAEADFEPFKSELVAAIGAHDFEFFRRVIGPETQFGFSGEDTIESFMTEWKLDSDPQNSLFWMTIEKIVSIGCQCDTTQASGSVVGSKCRFPAFAKQDSFPEASEHDLYGTLSDVSLYNDDDVNSQVLQTLSRETVHSIKRPSDKPRTKLWQVRTFDGVIGYVEPAALHSPSGYRLSFERYADGWRLSYFMASE